RTRAGRTGASTSPSRSSAMPYTHPEALVSTEWLAAHLDDPQVRVLDASYKQPGITPTAREDYQRGHIPDAVFFDIDDVAQSGTSLPHMIPTAERFAEKMAERGVGNDDRVVVYDTVGLSSAGRAWWMLRLYGHDNVALLDGGLPKWQAEGRPLDTAAPAIPPRRFAAAGGALDGPIVTSCGSGVTACAVAFAVHLLGHPGAAVYDGSWSEWGLPGDTPVETGPARK